MTASPRHVDAHPTADPAPLLHALAQEIERAFRDLPAAELKMLRLRFGIGAQRRSLRDTARRLRLSLSAARRLETRALRTLRALALPADVLRQWPVADNVPRAGRVRGATAHPPQRAADEVADVVGC